MGSVSRLSSRKSFIWGLENCNSGDTDSGKTQECSREEKEPGAYTDKTTRLLELSSKNCN